LQALKKAEQRNVDAAAVKPHDATAVPTTTDEVAALQTPVLPASELRIQADVTPAESMTNPVYAQSGLKRTIPESGNASELSLFESQTAKPAATSQPRPNLLTSNGAAPSPEAVRFMTYKREQFGQKSSRPVARWLPWSAAVVAFLLFVLYWGVELYAPAPQFLATLPPPVVANAPTPIPSAIPSSAETTAPIITVESAPAQTSKPATTVRGASAPVPKSALEQEQTRSVSAPATPEQSDISIRKDTVKTGTDELDLAYQELVRGNLSMAERRYRDLLAQDRLNPDIWTGLGAVLMRQGKPEEAESLFRRAQELNPTDPYARAMLLSLSRSPDAYKDSQYTTLANNARSSSSQAAVFALLAAEHATAKRWNEAQQAFFNALTADPGNPDYAFNLAVTLEHMRQPRLAYDFYRQALEFAKGKRPSFDLSRAQSRLSALKPAE
jgi:Tfp pilus assembly protein PilF